MDTAGTVAADYVLLTGAGGLREGLRLVPRDGRESPEQVPGLPPVPHEAEVLAHRASRGRFTRLAWLASQSLGRI